jgi:hypothetical protein
LGIKRGIPHAACRIPEPGVISVVPADCRIDKNLGDFVEITQDSQLAHEQKTGNL